MKDLSIYLQALVASSVFFVWVVRYHNIVEEFKQYKLPAWLRDLVGILKLTLAALLLIGIYQPQCAVVGGIGVALLMACAAFIHLRVKNPFFKMLPSLTLLLLGLTIAFLQA